MRGCSLKKKNRKVIAPDQFLHFPAVADKCEHCIVSIIERCARRLHLFGLSTIVMGVRRIMNRTYVNETGSMEIGGE